MKIVKWTVVVTSIIILLVIIFIPKQKYPTNSDKSPYIGGNPDCLGISIPLSCDSYTCDNLCFGKVLYYGAVAPSTIGK